MSGYGLIDTVLYIITVRVILNLVFVNHKKDFYFIKLLLLYLYLYIYIYIYIHQIIITYESILGLMELWEIIYSLQI